MCSVTEHSRYKLGILSHFLTKVMVDNHTKLLLPLSTIFWYHTCTISTPSNYPSQFVSRYWAFTIEVILDHFWLRWGSRSILNFLSHIFWYYICIWDASTPVIKFAREMKLKSSTLDIHVHLQTPIYLTKYYSPSNYLLNSSLCHLGSP